MPMPPRSAPSSTAPINVPRLAVIGGGANGLLAAIALKFTLKERVEVCVYDPALVSPVVDYERAVALTFRNVNLLKTYGLWDRLEAYAQPIHKMVISDSALDEPVRLPLLTFEAPDNEPDTHSLAPFLAPFLAMMVKTADLITAARECAQALGVVFIPFEVERVEQVALAPFATLHTANKDTPDQAQLVVIAQGALSPLREAHDMGWVQYAYDQCALVATVAHTHDHEGRAFQHFLPAGSFAVLPLLPVHADQAAPYRSSLVWTEQADVAAGFLHNEAQSLTIIDEICKRAGAELGDMTLASPVKSYPLHVGLARHWVKNRLVLIGDSAHIIHPLAGQGLNLGLQDSACLAQCLNDTLRCGLDLAEERGLHTYVRTRRPKAVEMAIATHGLNTLFSNDITPLRLLRQLGMGALERMESLKHHAVRRAGG
jgi:2-octaprenyl-6-methoxyphenol hydroxylase